MTSYQKYAELRDKKEMNDFAVSKETGINQAVLSDWKNGRYEPKIEKRLILARFFGVPVEALIGD